MKMIAATFPENSRTEVGEKFCQNFAEFFARVGETFRLHLALGDYARKTINTCPTCNTFGRNGACLFIAHRSRGDRPQGSSLPGTGSRRGLAVPGGVHRTSCANSQ